MKRARYELTGLDDYDMAVTISMPLKEWRELHDVLRRLDGTPVDELWRLLSSVLERADDTIGSEWISGEHFTKKATP